MSRDKRICMLLLLPAIGLACAFSTPAAPLEDLVGSAVAATQAAQIGTAGADTPSEPTPGPGETPATPEPACLPAHPGRQILPLPAGVASGYEETVTFTDVLDHALGTRAVTGMTFLQKDFVHLAGNLAMGANALPVVYYGLESGGKLKTNVNNVLSDLAPAPNLTSMTGAEGNPFVVFVTVDMMNQSINHVYAGALAEIASLLPVLTWTPDLSAHIGNAIHPLAVRYTGGAAQGFWYTYTMEGIGNIIFPPYNGLYFFDLAASASTGFLPTTDALGGISPDQTMIAYGAGLGGAPGRLEGGLTVRNLVTCQETYIPFHPSSNLGGGWMVFSPDNQFVAWTEAGGPSNMEATFRMRVARTDGTSLFDAPIANMTSLFGGEAPDGLRPVGWVASHILVLESQLNLIGHPIQIIWAPDPAQPIDPVMGAHQSNKIGDGVFLGFVYP
ncbi:MAG: hypothetical protein JW748_15685 [Anaerolineales bacterium]|nr:hypothetical protein [Anaerolineales bacterium]